MAGGLPIFNPRAGRDLVRDPIYDYIWFTAKLPGEAASERDLIDSRWLQRLRRIHQLQTAWLVYPGATHDRFSHSLGTMHLSGELAGHLVASLERQKKGVPPAFLESLPGSHDVVETARLYGLLHDIGHGPFGHLLDQVWLLPQFGITHEHIGALILDKELGETVAGLRRSPDGDLRENVDLAFLKQLITAATLPAEDPFWKHALSQALSGLYSPDKLDYVSRDAYYCGTAEYGQMDKKRLCLHSFIDVTEVKGLALHSSAEGALAGFIAARLAMYDSVYFHRSVREADACIAELLPRTMELLDAGDPREQLERYYSIDEWYLFSAVRSWLTEGDQERRAIADGWEKALARPFPMRQAYEWKLSLASVTQIEKVFLGDLATAREQIEERIRKALPEDGNVIPFRVDLPALDVKPLNPLADKSQVAIFRPSPDNPSAGAFDSRGVSRILAALPVKFVACRVFAAPEHVPAVAQACQKALPTDESSIKLQETLF